MNLPVLYTDPKCALCKSFSKKIKAKITDRLEILEIEEGQDLKYINDDVEYLGIEATQKLVEDFPELKEFLWLLPQALRGEALIRGYKWSHFLRRILFRRSCKLCPK